MLCLSMYQQDSVWIGEEGLVLPSTIEVFCMRIEGDKVRMGFTADPCVAIDRVTVAQAKEASGARTRKHLSIPPVVVASDESRIIDEQRKIISRLEQEIRELRPLATLWVNQQSR